MAGLRILVAASEVVGFAKTGGLADVAGALPRALAAPRPPGRRASCRSTTPSAARQAAGRADRASSCPCPLGDRILACRLYRSHPAELGRARLLRRARPVLRAGRRRPRAGAVPADHARRLQGRLPGQRRAVRSSSAGPCWKPSRASASPPDVIHANDWQTGLIPALLSEVYRRQAGLRADAVGVHHPQHRLPGPVRPRRDEADRACPAGCSTTPSSSSTGASTSSRPAIVFADAVNTVSPTLRAGDPDARVRLRPGRAADRQCRAKLSGIVNGVDYDEWDPARDRAPRRRGTTPTRWSRTSRGARRTCRSGSSLPQDPDAPVLGMVARLVSQKGIDLVIERRAGVPRPGLPAGLPGRRRPGVPRRS